MKKVYILLALWVLSSLPVIAQNFNVDGVYYKIKDGEGVVTFPPVGDQPYSGDVAVPASVEYNGSNYKVTSVESYAFADSENLTSVSFPESIRAIGRNAFSNCPELNSVKLPELLAELPPYSFQSCSSLQTIYLPANVSVIEDFAFSDCISLQTINLPEKLKAIGEGAFNYCISLEDIKLPENLESVGPYAFRDCNSLTSVNLPKAMKDIPEGLLSGCSKLSSLNLPQGLTTVGDYAFKTCMALSEVTIPKTVTSIGDNAFELCINLQRVKLQTEQLTIGDYAFSGCSLQKVDLTGVTEIGYGCFMNNVPLQSVTFQEGMKSIGTMAFAKCDGVTVVNCYEDLPPFIPKTAFDNVVYETATLHVLRELGDLYRQTPAWSLFIKIEDNLEKSGVEDIREENLSVVINFGEIRVKGLSERAPYQVYTLSGQKIVEGSIDNDETISLLQSGTIYIVKIGNRTFKIRP